MSFFRIPMKKSTLVISTIGIASALVFLAGGFLMNPICMGVGVAGLLATWYLAVSYRKPKPSDIYV
jgi:uncharacterized membrane protein